MILVALQGCSIPQDFILVDIPVTFLLKRDLCSFFVSYSLRLIDVNPAEILLLDMKVQEDTQKECEPSFRNSQLKALVKPVEKNGKISSHLWDIYDNHIHSQRRTLPGFIFPLSNLPDFQLEKAKRFLNLVVPSHGTAMQR